MMADVGGSASAYISVHMEDEKEKERRKWRRLIHIYNIIHVYRLGGV
jgi:hypothetical protein